MMTNENHEDGGGDNCAEKMRTLTEMKITVFWDMTQCSLVENYRPFGTSNYKIARSSGTSVNFYQTKGRNVPEHRNCHCLSHT
jgi:hypothetical protein